MAIEPYDITFDDGSTGRIWAEDTSTSEERQALLDEPTSLGTAPVELDGVFVELPVTQARSKVPVHPHRWADISDPPFIPEMPEPVAVIVPWDSYFVAIDANLNQDAILSLTGAIDYEGDATQAEISVNIHGKLNESSAGARVAAVLELWRSSGTEELLATMATGYIRDSNDHEEASYHCYYVDTDPGTDPSYEIRTRRDSTITQVLPAQVPSTIKVRVQ